MAIQHVDITDPQIHEPKGVSTAGANTVYTANGAGSGSWQAVGVETLDMTALTAELQEALDTGNLTVDGSGYIATVLADVSTAGSVIIPFIDDCTIISASAVLGAPIDTADATITIKNSSGASMGTPITIPFSGSGKGDEFPWTATGNNVLVGPSWIEIETDGASDDTAPLYITIKFEYTVNEA